MSIERLCAMSREELERYVIAGEYRGQDIIDLHDKVLRLRAELERLKDEKKDLENLLEDYRDDVRTLITKAVLTEHDPINHPAHYTAGKVECIDAIEAATTGLEGIRAVCAGNVIKYVWRFSRKNGVDDLRKARWYLDKLIEEVERNDNLQT